MYMYIVWMWNNICKLSLYALAITLFAFLKQTSEQKKKQTDRLENNSDNNIKNWMLIDSVAAYMTPSSEKHSLSDVLFF